MIPPRTRNAAATRDAMLRAARRRLLLESYENVGLRDIAGDAGVDVALVSRYFGSKEDLFREVIGKDKGDWLDPKVDVADLPAWLACLATEQHDPDDHDDVERLLILLRSVSSPKAAAIVRESVQGNVLEPLTNLLSGPDAEIRASLALSVLMGTAIVRTIMGMEPLCACDPDSVRARLTRLLTAALEA